MLDSTIEHNVNAISFCVLPRAVILITFFPYPYIPDECYTDFAAAGSHIVVHTDYTKQTGGKFVANIHKHTQSARRVKFTSTHNQQHENQFTCKSAVDLVDVKAAYGWSDQAIRAGRECRIELGLVAGQLVDGLNFVEIEWKLARNTAIQARLQIGGPVLAEDVLAASVFFADARDSTVDGLAAVDVFDGRFAEKEIHVVANVERAHEIRF